jgi:hypothetical protein
MLGIGDLSFVSNEKKGFVYKNSAKIISLKKLNSMFSIVNGSLKSKSPTLVCK